jgi:hypothetical protein
VQAKHYRWDDLPEETLSPLLRRRLIATERMMIAHVYLDQGCVVESEVVDVSAGEVLHIPPHLPHKAEALERTLDTDIFCPPRADWLDGSDAYLRR